jgi:hypothetical protein
MDEAAFELFMRVLDPDVQDKLAEKEQEWDKLLSSPRGKRILKHLLDEAHQQIEAGEIEDGGFGCE